MPRGPRLDAPGTLHHVMARGLDRQVIRDDRDRNDFVRRVAALVEAGALIIYAWTLLLNHPGGQPSTPPEAPLIPRQRAN